MRPAHVAALGKNFDSAENACMLASTTARMALPISALLAALALLFAAFAVEPQAAPARTKDRAGKAKQSIGKQSARTSRRFDRRRNRIRRKPRVTQPAPTPEPAPVPAPAPAPAPEPAPEPAPAPAPAPNGQILFASDFESGFTDWYVQSLSSRATLFTGSAFEGSRAARFEVHAGDVEPDTGSQRSEVSGPTFNEGQDLYIRDAIRVPSANTYSAPWQIIQQLHEENWGGSPGLAVFLTNQRTLKLGAGDSSPIYWQSAPLQADRWYDLTYRVKLSRDSGVGFVEVWLDGVQQTLSNGQARAYGQTIQTPQTYIKAGIYRSKSSTGTSLVEHDSIVVGTSLAAVSAK